jgi:hyaluronan synthase
MNEIPRIQFRIGRRGVWAALAIGVMLLSEIIRRFIIPLRNTSQEVVIGAWLLVFILNLGIYAFAWMEKPFTVTEEQRAELDDLQFAVVIPVFNEDPAVLNLCIRSVMEQERLPQEVVVVDDGSASQYPAVRAYWERMTPDGVRFTWIRQDNNGKRSAQAQAFAVTPRAHMYATLDSDTVLERRAIGEGLKPFADQRVTSVAGIEMGLNIKSNWLTRVAACRQLIWQLTQCSTQSVFGQVLVNRGTFAIYRADVVRKYLAAYQSETFFGRPVVMSDDSYLTLFCLMEGRTVQQPTAVQFTLYPETFSHNIRQWMRWMRGSTVRSIWRIRYLPVFSIGWFMTVFSLWSLFTSVGIAIAAFARWQVGSHVIPLMLWATATFTYTGAMRIFQYRRSDDTSADRLDTFVACILAVAYSMTLLKVLRIYSVMTCKKATGNWGTRQQKIEVGV